MDAAAHPTRPDCRAILFRFARGSGFIRGGTPVRRDLAGRYAYRVYGQFTVVSPLDPGSSSLIRFRALKARDVGSLNPLFSPDGQSIVFFSIGESGSSAGLRRVPIGGGAASTMATLTAPFGGSWGPDGISIGQGPGGVVHVPERGRRSRGYSARCRWRVRARSSDAAGRANSAFTLGKNVTQDGWDKAQIVAHSLRDRSLRVLIDGGSDAHLKAVICCTPSAARCSPHPWMSRPSR